MQFPSQPSATDQRSFDAHVKEILPFCGRAADNFELAVRAQWEVTPNRPEMLSELGELLPELRATGVDGAALAADRGGARRPQTVELGPSHTVLVIEDDDDIGETVCEVLQGAGYDILRAQNGQEALVLLGDRDHPGLILLDLDMPVMNGWDFRLLQRLDPELAAIPVVLASACSDARRAAGALKIEALLRKPYDLGDLLAVVERLCTG